MSLQDAFVTLIAIGAAGTLGWRWFRARRRPAETCASCQPANTGAPVQIRKSAKSA
ncbi:MAG TPA: hypothetical protein VFV78_09000 [Vicinamibacterales bacterium]|nr:hypothetical protein [Vicinamibacterales bacterium]